MGAVGTDKGQRGALPAPRSAQRGDGTLELPLTEPPSSALVESRARGGGPDAQLVQVLTLALIGALIAAGLLAGSSAALYAAICVAPLGDALAAWLRRRHRAKRAH